MILLAHMIFGAAIGSVIKNIPLAITFAFLGHYFLDLLPHIEYLKSTEESAKKIKGGKSKEYLPDIIKVAIDFLLGIFLIFIFSKNFPIIYLCALIAIVPDGVTVINSLVSNKLLRIHQEFHGGWIHFLKHKKISIFWRILTQAVVVVVSIILLSRPVA